MAVKPVVSFTDFILLKLNNDMSAQSWDLGRAGSYMEKDVENIVDGVGWNLVLHQKLHCEGGVTKHIVMVQDPFLSPLSGHFFAEWKP